MRQKILSIRDLNVSFQTSGGIVRAVRGVDLDLYQGETLAIVGESGSGKSVTVKCVMGIQSSNQTVESGEIIFTPTKDGKEGAEEAFNILKMSPRELRTKIKGPRIAMVFQDPMTSLDPTMTIGNQLMEGMIQHLGITRAQAKERAIGLLQMVDIGDPLKRMNNYPHQLSGGMRQRIVIAIALSCNPDILICDEPTTALDVTIQAKILDLIKELQEKLGISVIYITHDLGVVAKVADYVAVMYAGKIVERGTVDEVFYEPAHPYTWGLLTSMPDIAMSDGEELHAIPGSPPNLLHLNAGDAFAPRNEYALKVDYVADPPMFHLSDTHYASTWLLDERAPKVPMPEGLRQRIDNMLKAVNDNG